MGARRMTRAAAGRRCRGCGTPALGLVVAAGGTLFAGLLGAAALTVVLAFPLPSGTLATPARVAVVALAGLVLGDGVARSARVGIPVRPLGGFVGLFAGVVASAMRDRWVSSGLAEAKPGRDALARLDETLAALDAFDDQLLVREAALGAATSTTDESPALSSRPLPFVVDFGEALAALEVARARVLRDEKVEGELRDLEEAGR